MRTSDLLDSCLDSVSLGCASQYVDRGGWKGTRRWTLATLLLLLGAMTPLPETASAQIYAPEGVNMPGAWNGWTNSNEGSTMGSFRMAYRSFAGGQYVSTVHIAADGGDAAAGTYEMLFTSGPSGNPYSNKWAGGGTLAIDGLTALLFKSEIDSQPDLPNNQVDVSSEGHYTFILDDEGYAASRVVVLKTSASPVRIDSVSGLPADPIAAGDSVQITVYLDKAPSPEESIYLRYSTDFFQTSAQRELTGFASAPGGGVSASVYLPAQPVNSIIEFYALSTTVDPSLWGSGGVDVDLATLSFENNGGLNYKLYYQTTVLPSNGARTVALRPSLTWYSLSGATAGYDLQLDDNRDFSSPSVDLSGVSDTTYTLTQDLGRATTYYWRFKDSNGADWSNVYVFTTRSAVTYANVQFPASMTLNEGNQGTFYGQVTIPGVTDVAGESSELGVWFGWNPQAADQQTDPASWPAGAWRAAAYNEDKGAVLGRDAADEYQFELPGDIAPGSYGVAFRYVYVSVGDTVYGGIDGIWNATANPSPRLKILDEPLQTAPEDGAQDLAPDTSLAWSVSDTTVSEFNLQISLTPDFSQVVIALNDLPASEPSYRLPDTLARQTFYHWRVRSEYPDTVSSWTGSRSFTLRPGAPDSVVLLAPQQAEQDLPLPVTLTWSSSSLASSYEVFLSTDGSFATTPDTVTSDTTLQMSSLTRATTYSWTVVPVNVSGRAGSPVGTFEVGIDGGSGPVLAAPADGADLDTTTVALSWNGVVGVTDWVVQIDTSAAFTSALLVDTTLANTELSLDADVERGRTYHWRVRGLDAKGATSWSAVRTFAIKLPLPGKPTLVSPQDGAQSLSVPLTLVWAPLDFASGYEVAFGASSSAASSSGALSTTRSTTENRLVLTELINDTTYHWAVRAINDTGKGPWSDTLSFTTLVELPQAVTLRGPGDGQNDVQQPVSLTWSGASAATRYEVRYSAGSDYAFFSDTTTVDTTLALDGLTPGEMVYWKVRARNLAGSSAWSESRSFDVGVGGSSGPELVTPATDALIDADTASLTWSTRPGVDHWQVSVHVNVQGTDSRVVLVDSAGLATARFAFVMPDSLQPGQWIHWKVRGTDGGGATEWSETRRFRRPLPLPDRVVQVSPTDSAGDVPSPVVLSWGTVKYAQRYEVNLSPFSDLSAATTFEGLSDTLLALNELATEQTYHWSVRARGESGDGPWSDTLSFTTLIAIPDTPQTLFPSLDARIVPPVRFAWNPADRAQDYEIQIAEAAKDGGAVDFTILADSARLSQITYTSDSLKIGTTYTWRVRAWNKAGASEWSPALDVSVVATTSVQDGPGSEVGGNGLPLAFDLHPNIPNPFNPTTVIRFDVAQPGYVLISIHDVNGRLVQTLVDGWMTAGRHQAVFNGDGRPSGVYFIRMSSDGFSKVGRMTLLK